MAVTTAFQSDNERLNDDQKKRLNAIHEKYNAPGTSETTKKILNEAANMIRAEAGYTGGTSGNTPTEINSTKTKKASGTTIAVVPEDEIGVPNISDLIEQYNQAKMDSVVSGLKQARNTALSNLDKAQSAIKPKYYEARNAVSSSSQLGAKNFAEYLAQRGETNSGINDQAQISRNIATQGQIGGLRQQEAQDYANIEQSRADVNNSYSTDLANAKAGLESAALQAQIDEIRRQQELALQQEQFNKQFGLQEAGVTGTYGGTPTLAAQQFELQKTGANIDNQIKAYQLDLMNNPNSYENQIKAIQLEQAKYALKSAQEIAKYDPQRAKLEIERLQKEISNIGASTALGYAQLEWQKDAKNPDNLYKQAQIEALANKPDTNTSNTIDDYAKAIDNSYITQPNPGNGYTRSVDYQGIKKYLEYLQTQGVSEQLLRQLASRYGIFVQ
jgi:hypothetical protein